MNNSQLPKGYKLTEVGVIPEDWDAVLLDKIAKRGSGHTPNKKHSEYWNGDIKWISLADSSALDRLYIDDTFAKITPEGIENSSAIIHPAGTVVLSRDAGIGKSAIMRFEMAVSQHFMAWCCGSELSNYFLYYWLQSAKPMFEQIADGTTIKTIGLAYFKDLRIPLPSLPEQRSIATALSDMDELLGGLDRLIDKKRDLKQATMQQLLTGQTRLPEFGKEGTGYKQTEIGVIPKDWDTVSLSEIIKFLGSGKSVVSRKFDKSYPLYGSTGIIGYTDNPDYEGDAILIARVGANAGRLNFISGKYGVSDNTIILKLSENADINFFLYQFKILNLNLLVFGSGQPLITGTQIKNLSVKSPSLLEQTAIASILSDMDAEIAAIEQRRNKTRDLKQAMMQELLTGRIRLVP